MNLYTQPLPKGPAKGGETAESRFARIVQPLCDFIIAKRKELTYTPGARSWCYLGEGPDTWSKGDFDLIEERITRARMDGLLPLDIVAVDESREARGVVTPDDPDFREHIRANLEWLADNYTPHAIEEFTGVHFELWIEKVGLLGLFEAPAGKYTIPVTPGKGRPDAHSRVALLKRCARYERNVILMFGDHDIAGLSMTEGLERVLRATFKSSGLASWPNMTFERIGLNIDTIERMGLTWVDNLQTGSGMDLSDPKHTQHRNANVQAYIEQFGVRKCEADAIAVHPEEVEAIIDAAVADRVSLLAVERWREALADARSDAREIVGRMLDEVAP
jgi:hypothetical protein